MVRIVERATKRYKLDLSNKQKSLCQHYINLNSTATSAYKAVYDTKNMKPATIRQRAHAEMMKPHIAAYVDELRREHAKKFSVDREVLTEQLLFVLRTARLDKQLGRVQSVVMDIAKLHGLIIEKTDLTAKVQFQSMKDIIIEGKALVFAIGGSTPPDKPQLTSDGVLSDTCKVDGRGLPLDGGDLV